MPAEETLRAATTALAEARAERGKREGEKSELQTRMARLEAQAGEIEAELARREAESGADGKLQALNAGLAELSANVQRLEVELQAAEAEEEAALKAEAETRATAAAAKLASQELETELATLIKLLAPAHDWSPIVEEIKITSGYEQALGAALGDDLDAASDEKAPSHWRLTAASGRRSRAARGRDPAQQIRQRPRGAGAQAPADRRGRVRRAAASSRPCSRRARGSCPRKAISGAGTATASRPAPTAPPERGSSSGSA